MLQSSELRKRLVLFLLCDSGLKDAHRKSVLQVNPPTDLKQQKRCNTGYVTATPTEHLCSTKSEFVFAKSQTSLSVILPFPAELDSASESPIITGHLNKLCKFRVVFFLFCWCHTPVHFTLDNWGTNTSISQTVV